MNFNWTEEFIVNAIFSAIHAGSVYKNHKKSEMSLDKDLHTEYEELLINPKNRDEFSKQLSALYAQKASDINIVNRSTLKEIARAFKNLRSDKNNMKGKITGFFNNLKQIKSDRDLSLKIINASFDSGINNLIIDNETLYMMQIQEGKSLITAFNNAYSKNNLVDNHKEVYNNVFNKISYGITDNLGNPDSIINAITSNVIPNITRTSPKESDKQQESDQKFSFDNNIGATSNDIEAVKALMELFALDEVPENTEELKLINEQINSLNDPTLNALIIMLSKNYDKVIDES